MANPNILQANSVTGHTIGTSLGTAENATIVVCPPDKILKINSISVNSGGDAVDVWVDFYDASEGATLALAGGLDPIAVAPLLTWIRVLDKDLTVYLEEGDEIQAHAGGSGLADLIVSYEEISE